jgi:hypothetical protein
MTTDARYGGPCVGARVRLLLSLAPLVACRSTWSSSEPPLDGGGGEAARAASDASEDSSSDGGTGTDGSPGDGAGDAAAAQYSDLTDPSKWTFFDVLTANANALGYVAAVFDGRYVDLMPFRNGDVAARYDPQAASFTDKASWTFFDVSATYPDNPVGGASFDGRYVYMNAFQASLRYDTKTSFTSASSWTMSGVLQTLDTNAYVDLGSFFDGRYAYFTGDTVNGGIGRYDTTATFGGTSSWEVFDGSNVAQLKTTTFQGGVFDGRYAYVVPNGGGTGASSYSGGALRYDTTKAFTTASSWEGFDASGVDPKAQGFYGGVFDGRYVYYVPNIQGVTGTASGLSVRYDTTGAFTQAASWQKFDTSTLDAAAVAFQTGAFDGRYIYFVPTKGVVVRFDTKGSFTQASAWSKLDLTTLEPNVGAFTTSVFDGRYLYFVAHGTQPPAKPTHVVIARFDARTPAALPTGYRGSFF